MGEVEREGSARSGDPTAVVPAAGASGPTDGRAETRTPRVILCPRCGVSLVETAARSHYGAMLTVEHCPQCGGLWTSWGRIVAISLQSVSDLSRRASGRSSLVPISTPTSCPHCGSTLATTPPGEFPAQVTAPEDMRVRTCPLDHGLWLDAGEIARFKVFQAEALERKRRKYSEEKALRARMLGEPMGATDRLGRVGSRLVMLVAAILLLSAFSCVLRLLWVPVATTLFPR